MWLFRDHVPTEMSLQVSEGRENSWQGWAVGILEKDASPNKP